MRIHISKNEESIEPTIYDYFLKGLKIHYINKSSRGETVHAFRIVDALIKTNEFYQFLCYSDNPTSETDDACHCKNNDITTSITIYYDSKEEKCDRR